VRYYYNSKPTAEESLDLSVYNLKRRGMLTGHAAVEITWISSCSGKESTVSVIVDITDDPHITLIYGLTDREGNKTDYNYEVSLLTTPCTYGSVRYWFACPVCHERVGVLYLAPGNVYFTCRHCNNITYHSRNRCRIASFGHTSRQIDKLRSEIKRWTWRGRPTRKVRRLQALQRKAGVLGGYAMARIDKLKARISKH
jgi:hypothetical protein